MGYDAVFIPVIYNIFLALRFHFRLKFRSIVMTFCSVLLLNLFLSEYDLFLVFLFSAVFVIGH